MVTVCCLVFQGNRCTGDGSAWPDFARHLIIHSSVLVSRLHTCCHLCPTGLGFKRINLSKYHSSRIWIITGTLSWIQKAVEWGKITPLNVCTYICSQRMGILSEFIWSNWVKPECATFQFNLQALFNCFKTYLSALEFLYMPWHITVNNYASHESYQYYCGIIRPACHIFMQHFGIDYRLLAIPPQCRRLHFGSCNKTKLECNCFLTLLSL